VAGTVRQRKVDFQVTPEVESELRQAGANAELLTALREAAPKLGRVVVRTSPDAEVYLDYEHAGRASADGRLVISNVKEGEHNLQVSLTGKKVFMGSVTVQTGEKTEIEATLADQTGSIKVQTSAGAEVLLDGSSRGYSDAAGQLLIPEVAPGAYEVRARARGKREGLQSITVVAGQESSVEIMLEDTGPPPSGPVLRKRQPLETAETSPATGGSDSDLTNILLPELVNSDGDPTLRFPVMSIPGSVFTITYGWLDISSSTIRYTVVRPTSKSSYSFQVSRASVGDVDVSNNYLTFISPKKQPYFIYLPQDRWGTVHTGYGSDAAAGRESLGTSSIYKTLLNFDGVLALVKRR
jgi:hypothetical protein